MTTTILFGGTFDPVHLGHLHSAIELQNTIENSRVILVPCFLPAHRATPLVTPEDRVKLLTLALEDYPALGMDDCEIRREGTSYTIDTLKKYRHDLGDDAPLAFVMGSDAWPTLPTWHEWQSFTDHAHLIILERPVGVVPEPPVLSEWAAGKDIDAASLEHSPSGGICHLTLTSREESATEIRRRLADGDPVDAFLPPNVNRYIREHHLYLT